MTDPTAANTNAAEGPQLSLRDAERVVDALNRVLEEDVSPRERARLLLVSYQRLLGRNCDVQLILYHDLDRAAGPRIMDRVTLGPMLEKLEPRTHAEIQAVVDSTFPAMRVILSDTLSNIRMPRVFVPSEDLPAEHRKWYRDEFVAKQLAPHGWCDLMIGCWASGPDRLVAVSVYRRNDEPVFNADDRRLASLMLRAAAPVIHREMFDAVIPTGEGAAQSPLEGRELSDRQRDVLVLLLRGHSEKEAARDLGVSTHTVHTHVKRLYGEFNVSSRGELLALFIDRRILRDAAA